MDGSLIVHFGNNNNKTAVAWLTSDANKSTVLGNGICQLERTTCSLCEAPRRDPNGRKEEGGERGRVFCCCCLFFEFQQVKDTTKASARTQELSRRFWYNLLFSNIRGTT